MAVIDPTTQVRQLYNNDGPHRIYVAGIRGVNTGDTLDVGTWFSKLQTAIFSSLTSNSNGLPTGSGTTITCAQTGLANDTGVLLLVGGWV